MNLPTTAIENSLQIQLPEDLNEQLEVHVTATATAYRMMILKRFPKPHYINATGAH
ncbi:hypothetical protein O9992_27920 [Vibrio lentus]|nr:hypothetical protein [Vibrio lentus]